MSASHLHMSEEVDRRAIHRLRLAQFCDHHINHRGISAHQRRMCESENRRVFDGPRAHAQERGHHASVSDHMQLTCAVDGEFDRRFARSSQRKQHETCEFRSERRG